MPTYTSPARAKLNAAIRAQSTATLVASAAGADRLLDGMATDDPDRQATMLARAAVLDEIEKRHDLVDLLETIYMDDDYAGSYLDAVRTALAQRGVRL